VTPLLGRPLFLWTVLFLAGIVAGFFLSPTWSIAAVFATVGFLLWLGLIRRFHLSYLFLLLALAIPAGYWMSALASHEPISVWQEGTTELVGIVESVPQVEEGSTRFFLQCSLAKDGDQFLPYRAKVYVRIWQEEALEQGDVVRASGKLTRPTDEFALYLRTQGSFWTFGAGKTEMLGSALTPFGRFWLDAQTRIGQAITEAVPAPEGPILAGLLLGRVAGIPEESARPYRETGTAHILAASGLNVVLIASFLLLLGRWLHLPRRWPVLLALLLIPLYATLCGWVPSIARAAIMAEIALVATLVRREKDFPTTMAVAALVVLVLDPLALFALDFQLSFLATICLFAFLPDLVNGAPTRIPVWLKGAAFTTIAAQIGVLPLLASVFHSFPLVAPIANLLILPIVALLTPLGLLSALVALVWPAAGQVLLWVLGKGVWLMDQLLRGLAQIPLANLIVPDPPWWLSFSYWLTLAVALTACLLYAKRRWRKPAVVVLIVVFLLFVAWEALVPAIFPPRLLQVHFIDVGQGDSILVRTPEGANLLFDGGAGKDSLRYLEDLGIRRLDAVFLSHFHDDHMKGIMPILERIPVQLLLFGPAEEVPAELLALLREQGIPQREVSAGFRLTTGQTTVEIISPSSADVSDWKINDQSLVELLIFGQTRLLFTGDIEEKGRAALSQSGSMQAEVLKVPHHGSGTSLDDWLLDQVTPRIAVISVGPNSFGHPSATTLALLAEHEVPVLQTKTRGTILLQSDGQTITISTEK
jgi:competence protein ComEC